MSSEKQKVILWVLGVLVMVIWVRGLTVKPVRSGEPSPAQGLSLSSSEVSPSPAAWVAVTRSVVSASHTEWGRNPFVVAPAPPAQEKAGSPRHVLGGILWDTQSPSAVLNNRLVNVGDEVNGWRVVEIREKEVILSNGSNTKTLTVK